MKLSRIIEGLLIASILAVVGIIVREKPLRVQAAFTTYIQWEVRTGGSDTACSGGFDQSQTAGMDTAGAVSSANTASPVFSDANYTFVSGDVGAYVYIASGLGATAGWYPIASVAGGNATLTGACSSSSSLTSVTWTVDYSQQNSAQFAFSDMVLGAGGTKVTSATHVFKINEVGDTLRVTGGTGFTAGVYEIESINVTSAVLDRSAGSAASTGGTGDLGGALASPGEASLLAAGGNTIWWASGSYTMSSSSQNVAGGELNPAGGTGYMPTQIIGYGTSRADFVYPSSRPTLTSSVSAGTALTMASLGGNTLMRNAIFNANSNTSNSTVIVTGNGDGGNGVSYVTVENATGSSSQGFQDIKGMLLDEALNVGYGMKMGISGIAQRCYIHDCITAGAWGGNSGNLYSLVEDVFARDVIGVYGDGQNGMTYTATQCTFAYNTSYGYDAQSSDSGTRSSPSYVEGCVFYGNGVGIYDALTGGNLIFGDTGMVVSRCAFGGNTTDYSTATIYPVVVQPAISGGNPFVDGTGSTGHDNWTLNTIGQSTLKGIGAYFGAQTYETYRTLGAIGNAPTATATGHVIGGP